MFSMVDKAIICGLWAAIHIYAKANNKYIKYFDRSKE